MSNPRHVYPGGNTRYGFYSFYDYLALPEVERKIILKGGPGVGKSTLMKKMGQIFSEKDLDIEYHWCSSDPHSLDGVVIGKQQVCLLDGTAPHVVDPVYPGAVDEIINLGEYWNRSKLKAAREQIIKLNQEISFYFKAAYQRLQLAGIAYDELKSYHNKSRDNVAVNRNILALTSDFLQDEKPTYQKPRHLFAAAITPAGFSTKIDSLITQNISLFGVKGSPGSGYQDLFQYVADSISYTGVFAEIYHNPFDPVEIDIILIPQSNKALIDVSANIIDYEASLEKPKYRRMLDFDNFLNKPHLDQFAKNISQCYDNLEAGIKDAVYSIKAAKRIHDELESIYIPTMNFAAIEVLYQQLQEELEQEFK